ncbi:unnamed protein product [Medioppia subpectinata]|uniref:Protein-tyrosine-phosphatase n=1 Tax=Medioppia subpectinata TaxID=1979941 RepID=A0A7R9Q1W7_9ACAR|nr:unnamed protein product [Medioppia subpectinata]CAG2109508.1 unnamed protein product [Medioppia subpectinata]
MVGAETEEEWVVVLRVPKPLRMGCALQVAQTMKMTRSGHGINAKVVRRPMSQKEAEKIARDPNSGPDFQVVFNPPLSICNKLTKYVYLSGIAALTKENLELLGITLIINATYEWPNVEPEGVTCYRVPVDDSEGDDIGIYFDDVSDKIEENAQNGGKTLVHCMAGASRSTTLVLAYLENAQNGGKTLVHCMAGASRSTTLVLAYLVKYERIALKNAFSSVKKRRETARPNVGFWDQLIKYEIKIRGVASVKMLTKKVDGFDIIYPDFYEKEFQALKDREINKQLNELKEKANNPDKKSKSQKQYNSQTNSYE